MFYQEINPGTPLRAYVQKFTAFQGNRIYDDPQSGKVLSSLGNDFGFCYKPDRSVLAKKMQIGKWLPPGLIWPQYFRGNFRGDNNEVDCFMVSFKPGQFRWLFPYSILEFFENVLAIEDLEGKPMLNYYHQMMLTKTTAERVDVSNKCLLKKVEFMDKRTEVVKTALKLIHADLRLNMRSVSEHLGMTDRHFRRVFSLDMGMQPKQYQKLVRISTALNMLDQLKQVKMAAMAYECGFFDQSHFINTFKTHIGITPTQYLDEKIVTK